MRNINIKKIIANIKKLFSIIDLPKYADKVIGTIHPTQFANRNFLAEKLVLLT